MGKFWKDSALNISVGTDTAFGDVTMDEVWALSGYIILKMNGCPFSDEQPV
jgi:hypothetical protein